MIVPIAVLELLVLPVALRLADLLQDHLLGRLRGDPAHSTGGTSSTKVVAHLRIGEILLRLLDGHLRLVVLEFLVLDHGADAGEGRPAGLAVDRHADVHLGAVAGLRGAGEALLHRLDHEGGVDHLLARDGLRGLQKLELVGGGDGHAFSPSGSETRVVFAVYDGLDLVELGLVDLALVLAALQHVADQVVGQHELGVASASRTAARSTTPSSISIRTSEPSMPCSAPLKRRRPSISSAVSSLAT